MECLKLTDVKVALLPPTDNGSRGRRVHDEEVTHLLLFVSSTGTKTWRYRKRVGSSVKEITLGQFPSLKRDEAVIQAMKLETARLQGHDPDRVHDREKHTTPPSSVTVRTVLEAYLTKLEERPSHYSVKKVFKDILRIEGDTPVADFDGRSLKRFLELNYKPRPGAAANLLRNITAAYNYAAKSVSPIKLPVGVVNPAAKMAGEIPWISNRARASYAKSFENGDYQRILKAVSHAYQQPNHHEMGFAVIELALYTGARPDEIKSLLWSELHGDKIVKKHHKTAHKNKIRFIHLFGPALKVLDRAKAYRAKVGYEGDYVFPRKRPQRNAKHQYVADLTHYTGIVVGLTRTKDHKEPVEFIPYNLRSGFINFALDLLGEDHISIVAENVGHDVETCRRYYRRHRDTQLALSMKKVADAFDSVIVA